MVSEVSHSIRVLCLSESAPVGSQRDVLLAATKDGAGWNPC
jgi:hypothetical protein